MQPCSLRVWTSEPFGVPRAQRGGLFRFFGAGGCGEAPGGLAEVCLLHGEAPDGGPRLLWFLWGEPVTGGKYRHS